MSAWMSEKPITRSGSQREDLVDLRAGEGADLRLLRARPRRPHGEAGDADDAVLLAERVQHLGRLFGQADDAPRAGSRVQHPLLPRAIDALRTGDVRAGGSARRTRTRSARARRGSPTSAAAAARRLAGEALFHLGEALLELLARRQRLATAATPRRRSGWRAAARRNRRRLRPRHRLDAALDLDLHAVAHPASSGTAAPHADWPRAGGPCGCRSWCRRRSRARRTAFSSTVRADGRPARRPWQRVIAVGSGSPAAVASASKPSKVASASAYNCSPALPIVCSGPIRRPWSVRYCRDYACRPLPRWRIRRGFRRHLLAEALALPGRRPVYGLAGLQGSGKSTLAAQIAALADVARHGRDGTLDRRLLPRPARTPALARDRASAVRTARPARQPRRGRWHWRRWMRCTPANASPCRASTNSPTPACHHHAGGGRHRRGC